jgi:hypothetical protein
MTFAEQPSMLRIGPVLLKKKDLNAIGARIIPEALKMVGTTGIEPVTPTMSR